MWCECECFTPSFFNADTVGYQTQFARAGNSVLLEILGEDFQVHPAHNANNFVQLKVAEGGRTKGGRLFSICVPSFVFSARSELNTHSPEPPRSATFPPSFAAKKDEHGGVERRLRTCGARRRTSDGQAAGWTEATDGRRGGRYGTRQTPPASSPSLRLHLTRRREPCHRPPPYRACKLGLPHTPTRRSAGRGDGGFAAARCSCLRVRVRRGVLFSPCLIHRHRTHWAAMERVSWNGTPVFRSEMNSPL